MSIRRIEIIGEVVRNLSEELRRKSVDVPWKKIIRMRDKLTHDYFGVGIDLTWGVIQKKLLFLKKEVPK